MRKRVTGADPHERMHVPSLRGLYARASCMWRSILRRRLAVKALSSGIEG